MCIFVLCVAAIWFAWLMLLMNLFYFYFYFFFHLIFCCCCWGETTKLRDRWRERGKFQMFPLHGQFIWRPLFYHTYQSILCLLFFVFRFFFLFSGRCRFCNRHAVVHWWYRCWCRNNSSIDKNHLHLFSFSVVTFVWLLLYCLLVALSIAYLFICWLLFCLKMSIKP